MVSTSLARAKGIGHVCNFPASGADDESGSYLMHRTVDADIFLRSEDTEEEKYNGEVIIRVSKPRSISGFTLGWMLGPGHCIAMKTSAVRGK